MHKSQIELPLMPADSSAPVAENRMLPASAVESGAKFSECRKYRFVLYRIWDTSKPMIMFVGLNPSTANETKDDATIRRVKSMAASWGYGGVYMMNCFPFISTDPKGLVTSKSEYHESLLKQIGLSCKDVVFAWGDFDIVRTTSRYLDLLEMFPHAKALHINKNGSPKHPLYCKSDIQLVNFN